MTLALVEGDNITLTSDGTSLRIDAAGGGGGGIGETIVLADHGFAVGASANSAAAIEALISATSNGAELRFPFSSSTAKFKLDRPIIPSKPIIVRGYGAAKGQTGGTGRTHIEAPAGFPAFIFGVNAQQSRVEDLKISQASLLTTTGAATYAPGTSLTTITGNTLLDIQNNQVIRMEGAGGSMVLIGRTAAGTSGSNSFTVASTGSFGNYWGYVGQMVSIAGAGAAAAALVGYIGTIGVGGAFTLVNAAGAALNASTTVTAAAITVFAPLVARVTAGGGTATLTIDSNPYAPLAVTGAKISHCSPAIYSLTQCHGRNIEVGGDAQAGLILSGRTTGGEVADTCSFYDCMFGAAFGGVIFQGNDAQVNSFFGCDFAGPQISVLDNSLLGNYFYGCHWAFNCGFQFYNQFCQIHGGYVESNTGYCGAGGWFAYTMSLANGAGLRGFGPFGGWVEGPPLKLIGPISASDIGNGALAGEINGAFNFNNSDPALGQPNYVAIYSGGSGGNRMRFFGNGASGFYLSCATSVFYNAETGNHQFRLGDVTMASVESYGMNLAAGKVLKVAGVQVISAQQAAIANHASDATVNAILSALRTHGIIAT